MTSKPAEPAIQETDALVQCVRLCAQWFAAHEADENAKMLTLAADRIESLTRARDELAEALEFYADPDTYFAMTIMTDPPCGEFVEDFSEDHGGDYDRPMPGKRARDALKHSGADK